jgi:hypothetical protein
VWGSDWPVCLLRAGYQEWLNAARMLASNLASGDRDALFGETAQAFYRLPKKCTLGRYGKSAAIENAGWMLVPAFAGWDAHSPLMDS